MAGRARGFIPRGRGVPIPIPLQWGCGRGRGRVGEGWGGRPTSSSADSVAYHLGTASEMFDSSTEEEEELEDVGQLLAQHMQHLTMLLTPEMEKAKKKEEKLVKEMEKVEKEGKAYRKQLEGIKVGVSGRLGQISALLNSK